MSRQFQFKGKLIKVVTATRRLPNGRQANLEIIEHPGAVLIVPFLDSDRVVMIHQFRPVLNTYLYELPAGTLNPGERPLACAGRELIEETGYRAGTLTKIGKIFPVPGYSTEVITIFKAEKLLRCPIDFGCHCNDTGGKFNQKQLWQKDPDEVIKVRPMTRSQIKNLFHLGRITDAKTISALAFCGIL